ncbi:MAG: hypothetical protein JNL98_34490 [Bryobacterales bacterium]|nr:hypothetical protein [Bryobacterales bacterium]
MAIPVFLSHPRPNTPQQSKLVGTIRDYFLDRDLEPRTLGVSDYDAEVPLASIRRIMMECNGVLVLALRRYRIDQGAAVYLDKDNLLRETDISGKWLTSPWCHIEAGMGFQLGLPVLVFRESAVVADGVLERGVMAAYMPEISLEGDLDQFFRDQEWRQLINRFEADVWEYRRVKGVPQVHRYRAS